jgi:hypothetical protein
LALSDAIGKIDWDRFRFGFYSLSMVPKPDFSFGIMLSLRDLLHSRTDFHSPPGGRHS